MKFIERAMFVDDVQAVADFYRKLLGCHPGIQPQLDPSDVTQEGEIQ